jgi:hypothetical protein
VLVAPRYDEPNERDASAVEQREKQIAVVRQPFLVIAISESEACVRTQPLFFPGVEQVGRDFMNSDPGRCLLGGYGTLHEALPRRLTLELNISASSCLFRGAEPTG